MRVMIERPRTTSTSSRIRFSAALARWICRTLMERSSARRSFVGRQSRPVR